MDVELVDSFQQTPLFYAAREGNVPVARILLSLGMSINFVDDRGATALDYAIAHNQPQMARLLTSMGAHINAQNLCKSAEMEALLKEVRQTRGAHRDSRKRKREVQSSACPNGEKRSAIVSWTYANTEAEEPEILRKDVGVILENNAFYACTFPHKSTTTAKRIRRSAPRPQETHMDVLSVCAWDGPGLASGFNISTFTY